MELKRDIETFENLFPSLLIVPYGIETRHNRQTCLQPETLLIVPYGIETGLSLTSHNSKLLLIVPYGIET